LCPAKNFCPGKEAAMGFFFVGAIKNFGIYSGCDVNKTWSYNQF